MKTIYAAATGLLALCAFGESARADTWIHLCTELDAATAQLSVQHANGKFIRVPRGRWMLIPVKLDRNGYFLWKDGDNLQRCRPRNRRTKFVNVYHSPAGRRIIWKCYEFRKRWFLHLSTELDKATARISIQQANGRFVFIPRGRWVTVRVRLDKDGYFRWKDGDSLQKARPRDRHTSVIKVYHDPNGRRIYWKCYGWL